MQWIQLNVIESADSDADELLQTHQQSASFLE
jgi:hypothetical protein